MTDADAPRPEPPAGPARSSTVLGRLADALRRQDWAMVLVEIGIVVIGVVIGFQVTAWGQERADRTREQSHLRQLAADLRGTVRATERADASLLYPDRAGGHLWAAFYEPVPPPRDSLLAWRDAVGQMRIARPVLGTAEALIATGDLALVQNDSLRSAITSYVEQAEYERNLQLEQASRWRDALRELAGGVDRVEAAQATLSPEAFRRFTEGSLSFPVPETPRVRFSLDTDSFLADSEMRDAAWEMTYAKWNLRSSRSRLRRDAERLLDRVEAQLAR